MGDARSARSRHIFVTEFLLSGRTPGELLAEGRVEDAKAVVQAVRNDVSLDLAMTDPALFVRLRNAVTKLMIKGWHCQPRVTKKRRAEMATAKATYEAVRDAIDRLKADSRNVTVAAIQQMVGGSNTTITLHKRRYEAEHPVVEAAKTIEVNPRIGQLVAEEIARAVELATRDAIAKRDEYKFDMERIAEEATQTALDYEGAEQALALAREQVQSLTGQLEQLRADVAQIRVDAGNQVTAAQMRADAEIEKAKLETLRERQEREAAQKALALAEVQLADMPKLKQQLDALREALAKEKDARTEAEKTAAVAVAKYEAEAAAHQGAQQREMAAIGRAEAAERRAGEAEARAEAATKEAVAARQAANDAQGKQDAKTKKAGGGAKESANSQALA